MPDNNKHGLPRYIPTAIKAEVRRECGFACVICGGLPVHYDHCSVPFKEAEIHDPADIVLLCPTHHSMKTAEAVSSAYCLGAREQSQGKAAKARWKQPVKNNDFECSFGSTLFQMGKVIVELAGEPVLVLEKGEHELEPIMLSGTFRDHQGNIICEIERNELTFSLTTAADFKTTKNNLVLTLSDKRVALDMNISDQGLHISKLEQFHRDAFCVVSGGRLIVGNARQMLSDVGGKFINCETAISIPATGLDMSYHPDYILSDKRNPTQTKDNTMANGRFGVVLY